MFIIFIYRIIIVIFESRVRIKLSFHYYVLILSVCGIHNDYKQGDQSEVDYL